MIALFGGPLSRIERAALVVGLLLSAALMWPLRGAISDTAYIWLQVARHLSQGAGLVLNPGERVYGLMNPLWVTLLADGMAVGFDGVTFAQVLGAASTLLTVPLFLQLMRRTVRTPALRALGTVAWASHAGMARWAMSGHETPLAVALVLGGFVALTEGANWGERPIRTGALWALAAITRPGAVLLLVLWGTVLLIDAQSRPGLRRLVFGMIAPVAIYGSWLVFARLYFGTFWPAVLSIRPSVNPSIGEWWRRLSADFGTVAGTEGVIVVIAVIVALLGRLPARRRDQPALRLLPLVWVVFLPALFAARGLDVGARQLLLVIPIVHWLAWWAVDRWWGGGDTPSSARTWAVVFGTLLTAAVVGQNLWAYTRVVLPDARQEEQTMNRTLVRWGRWLGVHEPPGTLVASAMPGALAYFGQVRILDLNGLFTPALARTVRQVPRRDLVAELAFAHAGRARYLVDEDTPVESLLVASPHRAALEPLDESHGFALYRIHWSKVGKGTALTR